MGNPLKTVLLMRGGKIEKDFPAKSLILGIQNGELSRKDKISEDGERWISLGKHTQLKQYFITKQADTDSESPKTDSDSDSIKPRAEKILVVEDEPPLFKLLEYSLKKAGYNIVWAKDGEEALRFVKSENPDLVITDIMMPYINGLQVLERVKNDPETCDIPFIILSSKALSQDIVKGLELGGDDYITKPFNPDEMLLRIKMTLKRSGRK